MLSQQRRRHLPLRDHGRGCQNCVLTFVPDHEWGLFTGTSKRASRMTKARPLEYVEDRQLSQAVASMTSDLGKHPQTAGTASLLVTALGMKEIANRPLAVRAWIEGFD